MKAIIDMNIRAVFWDIDGTMVMSEPVHYSKMEHIAQVHRIVLNDEIRATFHGAGDHVVFDTMQKLGMPGTMDEFLVACQTYYEEQLHTIDVREGFPEAFSYLKGAGVVQAAVSNGIEPLVKLNIERAGIGADLVSVIDLDYIFKSGLQPKPAADPYLDALRQVNDVTRGGIEPSECLVVEDSPAGVAAGKAAGMTTIFWKLDKDKACDIADYEAFTAMEMMKIIQRLVPAP